MFCPVDRYEKRHKNLAAHVSPAFRVEVGDVVTVGTNRRLYYCAGMDAYSLCSRPVPAAVEDGAFQRSSRLEEQSGRQVVWQVLRSLHAAILRGGRSRIWYYRFLMCYDCNKMTLHPCHDELLCMCARNERLYL